MLYYRVKPQYDQKPMFRYKRGTPEYYSVYVRHELFTMHEVRAYNLNVHYMEVVKANPKKVWFCFGARFTDENVPLICSDPGKNNQFVFQQTIEYGGALKGSAPKRGNGGNRYESNQVRSFMGDLFGADFINALDGVCSGASDGAQRPVHPERNCRARGDCRRVWHQ